MRKVLNCRRSDWSFWNSTSKLILFLVPLSHKNNAVATTWLAWERTA